MSRTVIVNRNVTFVMSRRLDKTSAATMNMHGMEARVAIELMGNVDEATGRLVDPETLDNLVRDKFLRRFEHMLVLRMLDPLVATLSNTRLINNAGWAEFLETAREGINTEGYYDTRRQALPPFLDDQRPLLIAEHPTGENLAYLIQRILAPHVYNYGIQKMRVAFTEKDGHTATFVGDVRPSPDFPQVTEAL